MAWTHCLHLRHPAGREVGPTVEISQAQLDSAISGTSNNTNGVSTPGQSADFNYNQSQMQDVLNYSITSNS